MSDKDSVDARLAEIEQRAKRARYVSFMGGYGETGDARELLGKDVPGLVSQLRDARAENERHVANWEQQCALTERVMVERDDLRASLAAVQEWAMVNETAAPPLDWAGLGRALAAAEQDEPKRCEHGFTDAHAVIETSFAPPPHPTCPGPVSQPTEGSEQ